MSRASGRTAHPARSLAAATAVGVLATTALTACGSSSSGGSGGSGGTDKSFTYWSMWRADEPQAQVIKAAVAKFQASSGVRVKLEFHGRDIRKQIGPAIAAGQAPDLWDQGADVLYSIGAQTGQSADLSKVYDAQIPGESGKVSDVVPAKYVNALPKDPSGSQRWMVPYEVVTADLFYNAADPSLATPPATWDDFIRYCDTLKAKGKSCATAEGDDGWSSSLWLDYLLTRDNGPGTMGRLWQDKSGAGWKQPGVLASVQKVQQLVQGGYLLKGYDATKLPAQENNWAQGKASTFLNGSWVGSETAKLRDTSWKMGAFNFPATKGGNTDTDVILFGWSIPKKAPHPAAAQKFIAFFLQKETLSGISTQAANLTPRDDIPAPADLTAVQQILKSNPARAILDNAPSDYGDKVLNPAFLDLWHGKINAQQFVDRIAKAQADYWKTQG